MGVQVNTAKNAVPMPEMANLTANMSGNLKIASKTCPVVSEFKDVTAGIE